MRITYDPEADALYIEVRYARAVDAVDIAEGVTADIDECSELMGVEILDARERLGSEPAGSVLIERLIAEPSEA